MDGFEKSMQALESLFAKDAQFALATAKENQPSIRFVDTFYDDGAMYIVTYAKSNKVQEIESNKNVALCYRLHRFTGEAYNIGHPLKEENQAIREKLIEAFKPWYFEHNNENDENMCYVKVELTKGFFYADGTGYEVDFRKKEAKEFPFEDYIVMV